MKISRGLVLAALSMLVGACAERAKPAPTVGAPPSAAPAPATPAPARREAPAPAPPTAPPAPTPRTVTPAPARPAPPAAPTPERPAPGEAVAPSVLYIGVQRANVREGPDVKSRILAVLTKGTKLAVLEKGAQWYRVRLEDGKEGWVAESVTSAKPD